MSTPPRFMPRSGRALVWLALLGTLAAVLIPASPRGFARYVEHGGDVPKGGDFLHYFFAAEAASQGADVYASYTGGYVYPPLLAAALAPLTPMGIDAAALVWYWSNVAIVAVAAVTAAWLIRRKVLATQDPAVLEVGLLLAALAGFELIRRQAGFAQTDGLVMVGFAGLLPGLMRPRATLKDLALAALGMGLAVNIKFTALAMLPYLLLTRRWGMAAASLAGTVAVALSTALVFGWDTNLRYLATAAAGLLHVVGLPAPATGGFDPYPVTWINSISVTSGLARAGTPALAIGVALCFIGWCAAAWYAYRRAGLSFAGRVLRGAGSVPAQLTPQRAAHLGVIEWSAVIAAAMVFSPQTTKRHLFPLLIPLAFVAMLAVSRVSARTRGMAVAAIAILAAGLFLPPGSMESLEQAWQHAAGLGWAVAVFGVLAMLAGLEHARAERDPLSP